MGNIFLRFKKIKFIGLFWRKSKAGGHYYYRFPKYVYEPGLKNNLNRLKKMMCDKCGKPIKSDSVIVIKGNFKYCKCDIIESVEQVVKEMEQKYLKQIKEQIKKLKGDD